MEEVNDSLLIKLLKETNSRLTVDGSTWLVWDDTEEWWCVYYHPIYAKKIKTLYAGTSLSTAIERMEGINY